MNIKVLIVDDDQMWQELYGQYLADATDIAICGAAGTVKTALVMAKSAHPDIVLMDLNLSQDRFDGIAAITEISHLINTKVIVVTSYFEKKLIDAATYAGAVEYVLKRQLNRLPTVIREVYADESPHAVLARSFSEHCKQSEFNTLSKSEKEILELKKRGLSHREIEKMTYKTQNTIKHQIGSLLKKLHVTSCQEAIEKFSHFIN